MFDRKVLKANGKAAFKSNYWYAVLWAFVLSLLTAGGAYSTSANTSYQNDGSGIHLAIAGIGLGITLVVVVIRLVVGCPYRVGYARWRIGCAEGRAQNADIGYAFNGGRIGGAIAGIFFTDLIIFLWSLLFVIPGIVAAYKYRLVPYLMAENENMTGKEARARSAEMMKGKKAAAFFLDLSFIGWILLSILTCGILAIFWVAPYINATECELYRFLRDTGAQA